ncbi:MAG: PIN domain-containing protein [Caldilineaceae bacterium]
MVALQALGMQCLGYDRQAFNRAVQLAENYKIAIYDSYLIALAEQQAMDFVTADSKLWRRSYPLALFMTWPYIKLLDRSNHAIRARRT